MQLVLPGLETLEFVHERMRVIKRYYRTSLGESLKAGIQNTFQNKFPLVRVDNIILIGLLPDSGELPCESDGRTSGLCTEVVLSIKDSTVVRDISISNVFTRRRSRKTSQE